MQLERGFPPVAGDSPAVLVLGSLPGGRSLAERRYYAQPRNAFWPIMGALYGAGPELPYERRLECLVRQRIALWDVIAAGVRPGSLDSNLVSASLEFNDFAEFLECHPGIRAICFNGRTAQGLYEKNVLPGLAAVAAGPARISLPSTSPAHAAMPYADKLAHWRAGLEAAFAEFF